MNPKLWQLSIIIATVALFSCGERKSSAPSDVQTETINSARKYTYANADGKTIILENGGPKGDTYTAANGKQYFKALFWTRIINETDSLLVVKIDFPTRLYELSAAPEIAFKILVLPDTMAVDQMASYNFGITDLKSFLDSSLEKPSALQRTVKPKDTTGFFVVILRPLAADGPSGILRTGMILKGQSLVYRLSRYNSVPGHPLKDQTEIECGTINLKGFRLVK